MRTSLRLTSDLLSTELQAARGADAPDVADAAGDLYHAGVIELGPGTLSAWDS